MTELNVAKRIVIYRLIITISVHRQVVSNNLAGLYPIFGQLSTGTTRVPAITKVNDESCVPFFHSILIYD